jgi:hypothetical protein
MSTPIAIEHSEIMAIPAMAMPSFQLSEYISNPPTLKVPKATGNTAHDFYGFDSDSVAVGLSEWCKSIGVEGDVKAHLSALLSHARKLYFRKEQTCYWITIRITQSMDEWKIPRPHHDGTYWSGDLKDDKPAFKVGACLVGPGTIFWDAHEKDTEAHEIVSSRTFEKVREKGVEYPDEEIRQWAAEELDKLGVKQIQPKIGQAAMWIVGSHTSAGIHSEPDMSDMPNGRIL